MATTFAAVSGTCAHAEDWCGFSFRPGAIVQCGYSSLEGCENIIAKGAMCFVNPFVALNTGQTSLATSAKPPAQKLMSFRSTTLIIRLS
jgi:hypothetical protein